MSDLLLAKTDSGRAEIRARALPLSRAARNLLLVLDASKPAGQWLSLVAGATEADLQTLRDHGLVAPQGGAAAAAPAQPSAPRAPTPAAPAAAAASAPATATAAPLLDRAALYIYLSGEATRLLGPFKGYAFALEVERADKKRAHWQGVAIAAAEQSGRSVPLHVEPVMPLSAWLAALPAPGDDEWRALLSPRATQRPSPFPQPRALFLSGPEGGLSDAEEDAARARGFAGISLGPRILRADTAPLALLSWLSLVA